MNSHILLCNACMACHHEMLPESLDQEEKQLLGSCKIGQASKTMVTCILDIIAKQEVVHQTSPASI